ncbi:MAG TPA: NADH-quinone oxidoreductase subunit NuoF [Acidobacteriota bacterium]|nr:NADH-quinone oxidoreductase subunit NuoF [Acidobacteriota bacterium]
MPLYTLISKDFYNEDARDANWYKQNRQGFEGAEKAFEMSPEDIISEVKTSNLRGLGGAGFPTGIKWGFVPKDSGKPIYLAVNADESEPGTFKDKYIMTWDPHRLIEGIIITCWAIKAHVAYIYIRGEYVRPYEHLQRAIDQAYEEGILGDKVMGRDFKLDVYIHRGAGAYICGEETGLLESLEGKKGWPRLKPPFPAVVGAFGSPTVVNNVETIAHVPEIIKQGGQWFADLGCEKNGGTRLMCVSGHVNKPDVYEIQLGTPLYELIYDHAGGIVDGKKMKAVIPGGSSAKVLTAEEADCDCSIEALQAAGSMLGSGGVMVMHEDTCMVKALQVITSFYAHESCGQCTPCREGTGWLLRTLNRLLRGDGHPSDVDTMLDLSGNMQGTSICALSEAAAWPVESFILKFREEFDYIARHGRSMVAEKQSVPA